MRLIKGQFRRTKSQGGRMESQGKILEYVNWSPGLQSHLVLQQWQSSMVIDYRVFQGIGVCKVLREHNEKLFGMENDL